MLARHTMMMTVTKLVTIVTKLVTVQADDSRDKVGDSDKRLMVVTRSSPSRC